MLAVFSYHASRRSRCQHHRIEGCCFIINIIMSSFTVDSLDFGVVMKLNLL